MHKAFANCVNLETVDLEKTKLSVLGDNMFSIDTNILNSLGESGPKLHTIKLPTIV